jgi:hypothetical protein
MGRRRDRATGRGSGFKDFEQYALIPYEAMTSDAFRALPDYAVRVLNALAAQCRKTNNGDVCLTAATAKECGITRWKLFAGLELLQRTGLIVKTRQGGMHPVGPSLYALTWWPITESRKYDFGVQWSLEARNSWVHWKKPDDWNDHVHEVQAKQRGRGSMAKARERTQNGLGPAVGDAAIPRGGDRSSPRLSMTDANIVPPRGDGTPL